MFIRVPIITKNVDSRIVLNVNSIVATSPCNNGLCVVLSTGEEVIVTLDFGDFSTMLEKATGKAIVGLNA